MHSSHGTGQTSYGILQDLVRYLLPCLLRHPVEASPCPGPASADLRLEHCPHFLYWVEVWRLRGVISYLHAPPTLPLQCGFCGEGLRAVLQPDEILAPDRVLCPLEQRRAHQ